MSLILPPILKLSNVPREKEKKKQLTQNTVTDRVLHTLSVTVTGTVTVLNTL